MKKLSKTFLKELTVEFLRTLPEKLLKPIPEQFFGKLLDEFLKKLSEQFLKKVRRNSAKLETLSVFRRNCWMPENCSIYRKEILKQLPKQFSKRTSGGISKRESTVKKISKNCARVYEKMAEEFLWNFRKSLGRNFQK